MPLATSPEGETGPAVRITHVTKRFQVGSETVTAVDDLSLELPAGTFTCLYGASGSGKSTLLNLMAGLDTADAGEIEVAGFDVRRASEGERADIRLTSVGVVFQEHNLLAEFTAGENVYLPVLARGETRAAAQVAARAALEAVGVGELYDRHPLEMSGGQRQRVGIARALVGDRRVLLADEPTGALDSANSEALFQTIGELCRELGVTAVVATHDPLGAEHADAVLRIQDGRLVS